MERHIQKAGTLLITDEFRGYSDIAKKVHHAVIEHSARYVDGLVHTNTIEGFWSLLKRAHYGTHHHYTKGWSLAYIVESCYKYNARDKSNVFDSLLRSAVGVA